MRKDMVNQVKGQTFLTVKQHYDSMVRQNRTKVFLVPGSQH